MSRWNGEALACITFGTDRKRDGAEPLEERQDLSIDLSSPYLNLDLTETISNAGAMPARADVSQPKTAGPRARAYTGSTAKRIEHKRCHTAKMRGG